MPHAASATRAPWLRPGTLEPAIYDQVVRQNEYRVPGRFADDSLVLDVGAHVGIFSHFVLSRGAGTVLGFEPEPANARLARINLAAFGAQASVRCVAVWRSDAPAGRLPFLPSSDPANTGGGSVIWDTNGRRVDAVAFDAVVEAASDGGRRRIDLLKIDCEGAEFPILLTSRLLHRIDRIVGEYHELRGTLPAHAALPGYAEFAASDLLHVLRASGFTVDAAPRAVSRVGELGLFFATRARPGRGV